jgi:alpha-glucosidase (family GH31 glycosyl hydrolase)
VLSPSSTVLSSSSTVLSSTPALVDSTTAVTTTTAPPYRDIMKHYASATGPPPNLPHQYTGFWQCKLRYSSQEQILRIAGEYVQRWVIYIWRVCAEVGNIHMESMCRGG